MFERGRRACLIVVAARPLPAGRMRSGCAANLETPPRTRVWPDWLDPLPDIMAVSLVVCWSDQKLGRHKMSRPHPGV